MPLRQSEAMLIQRGFDSHDGGQNGKDCGAAHLDRATVAMVHARVAGAGRAHGGRLLRHATHWLGMTQHRPGEWPELKQKKQRCEHLHSSIVALAPRLDKAEGDGKHRPRLTSLALHTNKPCGENRCRAWPYEVERTGIEPATPCLQSRCSPS